MSSNKVAVKAMPARWMPVATLIHHGRLEMHGGAARHVLTGRPLSAPHQQVVGNLMARGWVHQHPNGHLRYGLMGRAAMLCQPFGDLSPAMTGLLRGIARGAVTAPAHTNPRTFGSLRSRKLVAAAPGGGWQLTAWGDLAAQAVALLDEHHHTTTGRTPAGLTGTVHPNPHPQEVSA